MMLDIALTLVSLIWAGYPSETQATPSTGVSEPPAPICETYPGLLCEPNPEFHAVHDRYTVTYSATLPNSRIDAMNQVPNIGWMMMPRVLNIKNLGYKIPNDAVYVGRRNVRYGLFDGFWGNPFIIGVHGTRSEVIQQFRDSLTTFSLKGMMKRDLRGKDLVCWCAPAPCHADVLLEMANE